MKKFIIFSLVFGLVVLSFIFGYSFRSFINVQNDNNSVTNNSFTNKIFPKPLEKYQIENLTKDTLSGYFELTSSAEDHEGFVSYVFEFTFFPSKDSVKKKTTGLINTPYLDVNRGFPIAILLRGYVDQTIYETGTGSKNIGEYLANNGYITIAPDFLGYGGSDKESSNVFESRFQTYTTVLSLIKTILEGGINNWDGKNILIWGHSNGGQIALVVLESTGLKYPTALWAPVSKPFPYSVLYYTDGSSDRGKLIRSELAKFEDNYDTDKYSLAEYLDLIKADLQIHQGTSDDAVPYAWTDQLVKDLEDLDLGVEYQKYPGADHNLRPFWNEAAKNTLDFFNSKLQ